MMPDTCNEQLDISYIINIIVQAMINVGLFYAWSSTLQHMGKLSSERKCIRKVINLRNTVGKRHKKEFKFIFGDRNLRLRVAVHRNR